MNLFESFHSLDRRCDDRVLQHISLRGVFVSLLVLLPVLGAEVFMTVCQIFRLHRVDWSNVLIIALLTIFCLQYPRLIYRRFGT